MGAMKQQTRNCITCGATVPLEQLVQVNMNENSLVCQDTAGCTERQAATLLARLVNRTLDDLIEDNPSVVRANVLAKLRQKLEG